MTSAMSQENRRLIASEKQGRKKKKKLTIVTWRRGQRRLLEDQFVLLEKNEGKVVLLASHIFRVAMKREKKECED